MLPRGFSSSANAASAAGDMSSVRSVPSPAMDISWFWQNGQRRLQPKPPTDKIILPPWNRRSGFFSTGSRARLTTLP